MVFSTHSRCSSRRELEAFAFERNATSSRSITSRSTLPLLRSVGSQRIATRSTSIASVDHFTKPKTFVDILNDRTRRRARRAVAENASCLPKNTEPSSPQKMTHPRIHESTNCDRNFAVSVRFQSVANGPLVAFCVTPGRFSDTSSLAVSHLSFDEGECRPKSRIQRRRGYLWQIYEGHAITTSVAKGSGCSRPCRPRHRPPTATRARCFRGFNFCFRVRWSAPPAGLSSSSLGPR